MNFYINRFSNTKTLEFDVEVVTPMFLGGADPEKAELRIASIKGALRFWWRAQCGYVDLNEMRQRESEIFGSTSQKASFSLCVTDVEGIKPECKNLPKGKSVVAKSKGKPVNISIIEYLAYGLYSYERQKGNVFDREYIPDRSKFKIVLMLKDTNFEKEIVDSLKLLANYGGLGARSRNGLGSIALSSNNTSLSHNLQAYGELKSFTAISKESILFDKFPEKSNWHEALSEIGENYRKVKLGLECSHSNEKRKFVATPLDVKNGNRINDRHAKSYFLHVNKLPNGKYRGQILYMPYQYYNNSKHKEYMAVYEEMNKGLAQYRNR